MKCISYDLPPVVPVAVSNIAGICAVTGCADRVEARGGDFFKDKFPEADVITMSNILHDWDENSKLAIIRKAYDALPPNGVLIAVENIIDDARRENVFGLLMSLNMLIETLGGFDYSFSQFSQWCRSAGFSRTELLHLQGPTSAAMAFK